MERDADHKLKSLVVPHAHAGCCESSQQQITHFANFTPGVKLVPISSIWKCDIFRSIKFDNCVRVGGGGEIVKSENFKGLM